MKKPFRSLLVLGGTILSAALLALPIAQTHAANIIKTNNLDDLNLVSSWITNGPPTASDVATWNSSSAGGSVSLGASQSWQGMLISSATPSSVTITDLGSTVLTLAGDGIYCGGSNNRGFTINPAMTLAANQSWTLGSGSGASIIAATNISGGFSLSTVSAPANLGVLTLNGVNTFSGGFTNGADAIVSYATAPAFVAAGGVLTSSPLGTGPLTLLGGTLNAGAKAFFNPAVNVLGDFTWSTTARDDTSGTFNFGSATRTITLTRGITPAAVVIGGGNNSIRFTPLGGLTFNTFTNGTMRILAAASVVAPNLVQATFGASQGNRFKNNGSLVIGSQVYLCPSGTGFPFADTANSGDRPAVTIEARGYYSVCDAANIRSHAIFSLAGAGTVLNNGSAGAGGVGVLTIDGITKTSTSEFTGVLRNNDTTTFATATALILGITKSGSTTQILSGTNTYSGLTTLSGGKLVTSTLSSNGIYTVAANTTLGVRVAAPATSLQITGLTNAASTLEIDLGAFGNPTVTVITNSGTTTVNGKVTVNVIGDGNAMSLGTFTLLDTVARGGTTNFALGTLPFGVSGTLADGGTSVTITITNIIPSLKWSGLAGSDWDISVAGNTNWLSGVTPAIYVNDPAVAAVFDDAAAGSTNVNVTTTVSPQGVLINNAALNYTFSGSGKVSGAGALTKQGSGTVTVGTANDYSGATTISAGTLKLGASNVLPDGSGKSDVSVGGTLDLAGFSETVNGLAGSGIVDVSTGTSVLSVGNYDTTSTFGGSLTNSGGTLSVTKVGTGTVTVSGGNHTGGTLISAGTLATTASLGSAPITNNATLALSSGTFSTVITGPGQVIKNGTGTLTPTGNNTYTGNTIITDGRVTVNNVNAFGTTAGYTSVGVVSNRSTVSLEGGVTVNEPLQLANIGDAGSPSGALISNSGSNTWSGNITIAGNEARVGATAGANLHISGSIDSGGNLYTSSGIALHTRRGSVIFSGASTYLGNTALGQGTNTIAGGNNRLPISTVLFIGYGGSSWFDLNGQSQEVAGLDVWFDTYNPINTYLVYNYDVNPSTLTVNAGNTNTEFKGNLDGYITLVKTGTNIFTLSGNNSHSNTVVSGGTLLVNGNESSAPVTVNTGGTLGGSGSITPSVNVNSGGALAPGVSGTGTLTINGALTLASGSQTKVDINSDDSTSDVVFGPANVSYNGTLVVNDLGAATVTNGQTFTLFSASGPSGNFSAISPASPAAGLAWSFNPASGVLSAVTGSVAPAPTSITYTITGNQLVLNWPNGQGWKLQSQTNPLASGLKTNWTDVSPVPSSPYTNTVNPANPTVFYRLVYP